MKQLCFFEREGEADEPNYITVSKVSQLPDGEFALDEFCWPDCTLWFVVDDDFTDDERESCRTHILQQRGTR